MVGGVARKSGGSGEAVSPLRYSPPGHNLNPGKPTELDAWARGPFHRRAAYYGAAGLASGAVSLWENSDILVPALGGATVIGGGIFGSAYAVARRITDAQLARIREYQALHPPPPPPSRNMPSYAMAPYRRRPTAARAIRSYQRKRATKLIRRTVFRMAEMKHVETALSSSAFQASPYSTSLVLCSQGTTVSTRIANSIRIKKLSLRGYVTCNASAVRDVVRILVVLDNQPNGAAPTVSGGGGILQSTSAQSNYNLDMVSHGMGPQRYRILLDRVIVLNQPFATTATQTVFFKRSWTLDIPVTYQSNAGTVSDVGSKNIQFIALSTTATNTASLTGEAQMCFIDA